MPTAKDVIRDTIGTAEFVMQAYLGDLSDQDLLATPGDGMNPLAWQLGHLLSAQRKWVESVKPGACPPLPEGFDAAHAKETAAPNAFAKTLTKDEYLSLWKAQHDATLAVLDGVTDEQLSTATGIDYAPTVASLFNMIGVHALMHAGQFAAARRRLGKPIVI